MQSTKTKPLFSKTKSLEEKSKIVKPFLIVFGILIAIALVIGSIFIIFLAIVPCTFKKCHVNATCISRPFNAKCKCNTGFQGNGIDCDECGLTYPDPSFKYLNLNYSNPRPYLKYGQYVVPFSYPSFVYIEFYWEGILYSPDKSRQYFYEYGFSCGGVLINRRTILTAASCVPTTFSFSPSGYKNDTVTFDIRTDDSYPNLNTLYFIHVKLFQNKYSNSFYSIASPYWPTETAYIQNFIIRDGYVPSSLNNDIALIKLTDSVTLDKYGQLACLPDYNDLRIVPLYLAYNNSAIAVGWEYYYTALSSVLSEFHQNIVYNSDCTDLYTNSTDYTQIICTRDFTATLTHKASSLASYCNGIAGGPLFVPKLLNGVNKLLVIGVALNDTECGLNIYANLFMHLDWINDNSDY